MAGKKINLAYITNDSARKAAYKKRKKGLMKKMNELSTFCGVDTCAIMDNSYESQLEVWPSPLGVQQVLSKFNNIPKIEQTKKMENQESFLSRRITKVAKQLNKHCKANHEKEMTQVMLNNICGKGVIHGLNLGDLNDLNGLLDEKIRDIDMRLDELSKTSLNPQGALSSLSSFVVALTPMTMVTPEAMPRTSTEEIEQAEADNIELMNNNNNTQTHVGGDEMMFQFSDIINPNNNLWSNAFFPWKNKSSFDLSVFVYYGL